MRRKAPRVCERSSAAEAGRGSVPADGLTPAEADDRCKATAPRRAPPGPRGRCHGAAMLLALLLMALVATLASAMLSRQGQALALEEAEHSRSQSAWILGGAQDWARLIMREDARAGGADHLGEPWATPLAEARLSSFLAADRDALEPAEMEAFLSGAITDAQSRYNLRNLIDDQGKLVELELATLRRLFELRGLSPQLAGPLAADLAACWGTGQERPIAVRRFEHLAWLGLPAATLDALRPVVEVLPQRTPLNLNTAPASAMAAVLAIDPGSAERLVQARRSQPLTSLEQARLVLPAQASLDPARVGVGSSTFEVRGRVRVGERFVQERSLLHRRSPADVVLAWRVRESGHAGSP